MTWLGVGSLTGERCSSYPGGGVAGPLIVVRSNREPSLSVKVSTLKYGLDYLVLRPAGCAFSGAGVSDWAVGPLRLRSNSGGNRAQHHDQCHDEERHRTQMDEDSLEHAASLGANVRNAQSLTGFDLEMADLGFPSLLSRTTRRMMTKTDQCARPVIKDLRLSDAAYALSEKPCALLRECGQTLLANAGCSRLHNDSVYERDCQEASS